METERRGDEHLLLSKGYSEIHVFRESASVDPDVHFASFLETLYLNCSDLYTHTCQRMDGGRLRSEANR